MSKVIHLANSKTVLSNKGSVGVLLGSASRHITLGHIICFLFSNERQDYYL